MNVIQSLGFIILILISPVAVDTLNLFGSRSPEHTHGKPVECAIYPIVISHEQVFVDIACPAWEEAVRQWDEQFGECIDDFNDVRDDHKYVNLWIAKSTMKEYTECQNKTMK